MKIRMALLMVSLSMTGCRCSMPSTGDAGAAQRDAGPLRFDEQAGTSVAAPVDVQPTPATFPSPVVDLQAGSEHTCARHQDGTVSCWGQNMHGQVGDGTFAEKWRPAHVIDLPAVSSLALGDAHGCALTAAGEVYCWGSNERQQLGAPGPNRSSAAKVTGIGPASALFVGGNTSCALISAVLWCWGAGAGARVDAGVAPAVMPISDVADYAVHVGHACAVLTDGGVLCRGPGVPTFTKPADGPTTAAVQIEVTETQSCARLANTRAFCWGGSAPVYNLGEFGLPAITGFTDFALNGEAGCGLTASGTAYCSFSRELDWHCLAPDRLEPGWDRPENPLAAGGSIAQIAIGGSHVCLRMTAGGVKCFGWNKHGPIGNGTTLAHCAPTPVIDLH